MNLREFISDRKRRAALATACATSKTYLWQLANRYQRKRPSPEMAQRIEAATRAIGPEVVTKESLIFGDAPAAVAAVPAKPRGLAAFFCGVEDGSGA